MCTDISFLLLKSIVLSDANNYYSTEKVIQQKSAVSKRIATQRDDGPLHVNISNCYDYCPRIMARTEDLLYWMEHCQVYNILICFKSRIYLLNSFRISLTRNLNHKIPIIRGRNQYTNGSRFRP